MICTQFYEGQGLGNQLWAYVTLRVIAEQKGLPFGVVNPQYFKGFPFLNLDFGEFVQLPDGSDPNDIMTLPVGINNIFLEPQKFDPETGLDITFISLDVREISDSTKIQGNFQDQAFIAPFRTQISEWLNPVEYQNSIDLQGDVCVINFRGGEYRHWKSVFLDKNYWHRARRLIQETVPGVKFKVVTDDPKLARYFFPADEILDGGIDEDYLSICTAKYLIISNSSFAWFPAWLNEQAEICIAPKYWAGYRNNKFWSCGYTINPDWIYLDHRGEIWNLEKALISTSVRESVVYKFQNLSIPTRIQRNSRIFDFRNLRWLPRRRRSRTVIWTRIVFKKIFGRRIIDGISNRLTNFKMKTNYSHLQFPFPLLRHNVKKKELVIDSFTFMDEFEILKLRLEVLSPFVDKFVILEAKHTFTGLEKPALLYNQLHLFPEYREKMQVVVLDNKSFTRSDFYMGLYDSNVSGYQRLIYARTLTSKNIPDGNSPWLREYFNKEFLYLALMDYPLNSRVVISDVDEIWNPRKHPLFLPSKGVYVYRQLPFVYFMNNLSTESWRNWSGSVTATLQNFDRYGINRLRTHHSFPRRVIQSGGWHFSFQGGAELILSKLKSYGHQELNTQSNRDAVLSGLSIMNDIRGIGAKFRKNERVLPPEVIAMKSRLPDWFL
jgi:hypothetical protein